MIKHVWSVLCRESLLNEESNSISLINILEQLQVVVEPKVNFKKGSPIKLPINYEIVSLWVKDGRLKKAEAQIEHVLVNSSGKIIARDDKKIEIPPDLKRLRTRLRIDGISITGGGDYWFRVRIKEKGAKSFKLVAELPLEVEVSIKKIKAPKA